jgi:mono/diheme cytochrome c family protein
MNPEILEAQKRENADPNENSGPVPWPIRFTVALLVSFGIFYIASSPLGLPASLGDGRSIEELSGPSANAAPTAKVDGAAIYASMCVACHQAGGKGLPGVFPPLAPSQWVSGSETVLASIVLQGVNGKLTVNDAVYSGAMPAFKARLDDAEVAAVLSYVRGQWGNQAAAVDAATVARARGKLAAQGEPLAGDEGLARLAREGEPQ